MKITKEINLTSKQLKILNFRRKFQKGYGKIPTQREIAAYFRITQGAVSGILKRTRERLKKYAEYSEANV